MLLHLAQIGVNPEVREAFTLKFNKEIYEGYCTTETTPVASVNIPDRIDPRDWQVQLGSKPGTVGLPLPGGSFRIVDPDTLDTLPAGEDGLILFGGTQVMLGYLKDPEKTAEVIVEIDGKRWYKTGDKGHLDEDGFLTIVDRYSRFAKIGGEMVSLTTVEELSRRTWPDSAHAVVSLPDAQKGEQLVLVTEREDAQRSELLQQAKQQGLGEIHVPRKILATRRLPLLTRCSPLITLSLPLV